MALEAGSILGHYRIEAPIGAGGMGEVYRALDTACSTILGTFQYMAPEQLEVRDTDGRTDLLALGAVLYEMVTGNRAFDDAGSDQSASLPGVPRARTRWAG